MVASVMLMAFPLWILFFNVTLSPGLLGVLGLMLLALLGFTAAGTLFSAMTTKTRYGELLLPVLLLPFLLPPIFAGAQGSMRILEGRPFSEIAGWLRILVVYDVAFLTVATLLFSNVVDE
jgi:heme exporter protein B